MSVLADDKMKGRDAPSDDMVQPVDLSAAAKYEEITRALKVQVAGDAPAPAMGAG